MAFITENRVRTFANTAKTRFGRSAKTILTEMAETTQKKFDIFLSHSSKDADIVLGAVELLEQYGFSVYVDWIVDPDMNRTRVTPETAAILRLRMGQCRSLLYLKTDNSTDSTWMPWELGYFDALRGRVGILPIVQSITDEFDGNEYLGLYPYVDMEKIKDTDQQILWINRDQNDYSELREWIN